MNSADQIQFHLKTLTPVWTGGVAKNDNSKLHITGIKGSIRWWYEALIRGLGAYACDPTSSKEPNKEPKKCELNLKELSAKTTDEIKKQLCPACYLFGCTNWSGKFNIRILEPGTVEPVQHLNSSGISFDLVFIKRKTFEDAEEKLLQMTLKLIVDYGAIGGKTIFKPSEVPAKNTKLHHRDFGVLSRREKATLLEERIMNEKITNMIKVYLEEFEKKNTGNQSSLFKYMQFHKNNYHMWPDLKDFWFAKGQHINRVLYNQIVDRDINTGKYRNPAYEQIFLGGFISREKPNTQDYKDINASSKKIFSFHGAYKGDPIERCFGYTERDGLNAFISKIKTNFKANIETGQEILETLL